MIISDIVTCQRLILLSQLSHINIPALKCKSCADSEQNILSFPHNFYTKAYNHFPDRFSANKTPFKSIPQFPCIWRRADIIELIVMVLSYTFIDYSPLQKFGSSFASHDTLEFFIPLSRHPPLFHSSPRLSRMLNNISPFQIPIKCNLAREQIFE